MTKALDIAGLSAEFRIGGRTLPVIRNVSLDIEAGETVCVVGESGSGKTLTGLSTMGLLPSNCFVTGGSIKVDGQEVLGLSEQELSGMRGSSIAMIFQDPMSALNPARTIGWQVAESVRANQAVSKQEAAERAAELLDMTGIPRAQERLNDFPHELSGGILQRVMIAMALAGDPKVLIADEPTTALDVTIQDQILRLLDTLKSQIKLAVLLVTHDMGVVARCADRVNVMYAGEIVESSSSRELFAGPSHRYTRGLLSSIPTLQADRSADLASIKGNPPELGELVLGCAFAPRCAHADELCVDQPPPMTGQTGHRFACWHPDTSGTRAAPAASTATVRPEMSQAREPIFVGTSLVKEFPIRRRSLFDRTRRHLSAVSDVSLEVAPGETLGLVGESGCGKSTLARMIVGLTPPTSGTPMVNGKNLFELGRAERRTHRRAVQMMFQDPYSSLDPLLTVEQTMREPLVLQRSGSRREQTALIERTLAEVGLPSSSMKRLPHEFSGGQRQRLGLARALILKPQLVVADEPVSALDTSIRSQILNVMRRVQRDHQLSFLIISHDLTVVRYLADRVGVMYLGKLVEVARTDDLYERPAHPYTRALLDAIPIPDPDVMAGDRPPAVSGELPSPIDPPSGCRFRTRCPRAQDICAVGPPMRAFGDGHVAACHFPLQPVTDQPTPSDDL